MNITALNRTFAMALAVGSCATSLSAQEGPHRLINRATNGCLRVDEPRVGSKGHKPIVDGLLKTSPCGQSQGNDVVTLVGAPSKLIFNAGTLGIQCIRVREIDIQRFPSDIFSFKCADLSAPASGWEFGTRDDKGFAEISLFVGFASSGALCLAADRISRKVVIDRCSGKPEQLWKSERVTQP